MKRPRYGKWSGWPEREPPCAWCPVAQEGADQRACTVKQCQRVADEIAQQVEADRVGVAKRKGAWGLELCDPEEKGGED